MPDIRADEPEAREPERLVFGDGEGSAPSLGTARAARVRRDSRAGRAQGSRRGGHRSHAGRRQSGLQSSCPPSDAGRAARVRV